MFTTAGTVSFICSIVVYVFPLVVLLFQLVGQFIARAVSDQILSKSYIEGYKGKVDCEYARYLNVGQIRMPDNSVP